MAFLASGVLPAGTALREARFQVGFNLLGKPMFVSDTGHDCVGLERIEADGDAVQIFPCVGLAFATGQSNASLPNWDKLWARGKSKTIV